MRGLGALQGRSRAGNESKEGAGFSRRQRIIGDARESSARRIKRGDILRRRLTRRRRALGLAEKENTLQEEAATAALRQEPCARATAEQLARTLAGQFVWRRRRRLIDGGFLAPKSALQRGADRLARRSTRSCMSRRARLREDLGGAG